MCIHKLFSNKLLLSEIVSLDFLSECPLFKVLHSHGILPVNLFFNPDPAVRNNAFTCGECRARSVLTYLHSDLS